MERAIELALLGKKTYGEVPIGAVIVKDNKIIAEAHNEKEKTGNPLAHAEILAIERATKELNSWRLDGCAMYVTLEPCPMCAGAIVMARLDELYFGAYDEKAGGVETLYHITEDSRLNHVVKKVRGGIMEKQCVDILQQFFQKLR